MSGTNKVNLHITRKDNLLVLEIDRGKQNIEITGENKEQIIDQAQHILSSVNLNKLKVMLEVF